VISAVVQFVTTARRLLYFTVSFAFNLGAVRVQSTHSVKRYFPNPIPFLQTICRMYYVCVGRDVRNPREHFVTRLFH